jgi:TonB family protein
MVVSMTSSVFACSMSNIDPNEMLENEPVYSANGLFCVIVRWQPAIPDFTKVRAGTVLSMDQPVDDLVIEGIVPASTEMAGEGPPPPSQTVTAALYQLGGHSRVLLRELSLDVDYAREVFVSDSGRYVMAFEGLGRGCGGSAIPDDPFLAIYRSDGSRIAALKVSDFLNPYDIWQSGRGVHVALRSESESREVAVLQFPAPPDDRGPRFEERRVALDTGALLDPRADIFPVPHAYAEPYAAAFPDGMNRDLRMDCAATSVAPIPVLSVDFFHRALFAPLPPFPTVAYKARIRGTIWVRFLVSEQGEVLCVRAKEMPFGLTEAAVTTARQWRFRPYLVDGHPVPMTGELRFEFQDVDAATWAAIERTLPRQE